MRKQGNKDLAVAGLYGCDVPHARLFLLGGRRIGCKNEGNR